MSVLSEADRLARSGRQREGIGLIEGAAGRGDPDALFMCGNWRLHGLYGPRDLGQAADLLRRAAERGHVEAGRLRAYMIGNGTGQASDPDLARETLEGLASRDPVSARQLALLAGMPSVDEACARPGTQLCARPFIRMIEGLLRNAECDYITALAAPALRHSFVIDPNSRARVPNPIRTSMGMSFGPLDEDLAIHALNRRLARATQTEPAWGEPLHVLRYQPGQEFRPHMDAIAGTPNQRRWTALIYLNDDYEGGETSFPELGLKVRGRTGDCLIFENLDANGRPDRLTRHAGEPVTSGIKWLATRWIRSAPYDSWVGQ